MDVRGRPVAGARVLLAPLMAAITDSNGTFVFSQLSPATIGLIDLRVSMAAARTQIHRVQAGVDSVEIGLVDSAATTGTARSRLALSVRVPPQSCWLLAVGAGGGRGPRIMRLSLVSP